MGCPGNIRHSLHSLRVVVVDLVGVAELDLDRNDGRFTRSTISANEAGPAGACAVVAAASTGRPRLRTQRRQGPSTPQRQAAQHGVNRRVDQTTSKAPSVSTGAAETVPPPHDRENALGRLNTRCREHESLVMWFIARSGALLPTGANQTRPAAARRNLEEACEGANRLAQRPNREKSGKTTRLVSGSGVDAFGLRLQNLAAAIHALLRSMWCGRRSSPESLSST